ncbi:hypothetical protein [Pistricoccus aurantiacus]|uniref:hypothetical protein n=1 Tax=Pistricoccus aurantiacus TaxID=1883414 RepID=UPI003633FD8D
MNRLGSFAAAVLAAALLAGCGEEDAPQRVRPEGAPESTQQVMQESRRAVNRQDRPSSQRPQEGRAKRSASEQPAEPSGSSSKDESPKPSNLTEDAQPSRSSDPSEKEGAEIQETGDSEAK